MSNQEKKQKRLRTIPLQGAIEQSPILTMLTNEQFYSIKIILYFGCTNIKFANFNAVTELSCKLECTQKHWIFHVT